MFLDRYLQVASEITDAPTQFHEYLSLMVASTILGNHIHLYEGGDYYYPNLWMILVAPSSSYRKSTSLNFAKRMIGEVRPETLYPDEFTQEKLLDMMQEHATGILFHYEFASLMGLLERSYMMGVKAFLTQLYDCPHKYIRKIKTKDVEITNPCLNMASATTSQWMVQNMKEGDILGGFIPRFMIIPAYEKLRNEPFRGVLDALEYNKCLLELKELQHLRGPMMMDDVAKEIYTEWFRAFDQKYCGMSSGILTAFHVRLETTCLKLSMIIQVCIDQSMIITPAAITKACELTNWLAKYLKYFESEELVFGKMNQMKKKVEVMIRQSKEDGISRGDLMRRAHIMSKDLDLCVLSLKEEGLIESVRIKHANGKLGTEYYLWADYAENHQPPNGHRQKAFIDDDGVFHPAESSLLS